MSALTDKDRAALREAIELIRDVVARHPLEVTGPILTAVNIAVQDVETVFKYLEAVE